MLSRQSAGKFQEHGIKCDINGGSNNRSLTLNNLAVTLEILASFVRQLVLLSYYMLRHLYYSHSPTEASYRNLALL